MKTKLCLIAVCVVSLHVATNYGFAACTTSRACQQATFRPDLCRSVWAETSGCADSGGHSGNDSCGKSTTNEGPCGGTADSGTGCVK